MRVLVCLPTGQHIVNLLAVRQFSPDRVVMPVPAGGRRSAAPRLLLAALKAGGADYSGRLEEFPVADDLRPADTAAALACAVARYPGAEWVVNASGGSKPMALAAYEFFAGRGAKIVYTNAGRPEMFRDLATGAEERWAHAPSVSEFLTGYGLRLVAAGERRPGADEVEAARRLAAAAPADEPLQLTYVERQLARRGRLVVGPERWRPWVRAAGVLDPLARAFGLAQEGTGLRGRLTERAGRFLTGEWLEVFLWDLLDRHRAALDLSDLRLGLEAESPGGVRNELDVIFVRRHALWVAECKSGSQEGVAAADALYKVEAVVGQFGARRVRSCLVTTGANVHRAGSEEVNPFLAARAALYRCAIVPRHRVRELARPDVTADQIVAALGL